MDTLLSIDTSTDNQLNSDRGIEHRSVGYYYLLKILQPKKPRTKNIRSISVRKQDRILR